RCGTVRTVEGHHPFVDREMGGAELAAKFQCIAGLAGAGRAADQVHHGHGSEHGYERSPGWAAVRRASNLSSCWISVSVQRSLNTSLESCSRVWRASPTSRWPTLVSTT